LEDLRKEMALMTQKAILLKALANPVRLCIIKGLLQTGGCNVSKIQHCLDMPQSTISQHLAKLRDLGIIEGERKGVEVHYRLISHDARRLIEALF